MKMCYDVPGLSKCEHSISSFLKTKDKIDLFLKKTKRKLCSNYKFKVDSFVFLTRAQVDKWELGDWRTDYKLKKRTRKRKKTSERKKIVGKIWSP